MLEIIHTIIRVGILAFTIWIIFSTVYDSVKKSKLSKDLKKKKMLLFKPGTPDTIFSKPKKKKNK